MRSRDAELLERCRPRGRGAEPIDADGDTVAADVLVPAERGACLDRDLRHAMRKDGVLVLFALLLEDLPARHGDNRRVNACALEIVRGLERHLDLRPRRNEDDVLAELL